MLTHPDIPHITICPTTDAALPAHFDIREAPAIPPTLAPAIDAIWRTKLNANPNLFDGPILLITADLPNLPSPILIRSTYKLHVCLDTTNLHSLGVQSVVIGRDSAGAPHLLLGRRSSDVRMYPGLWENAPSGGVAPPPLPAATIDRAHLLNALLSEGIEEVGLDLSAAHIRLVALLQDNTARSLDYMLRFDLRDPINPTALPCPATSNRWEYADTAWIPISQIPEWSRTNAHAISPPTLALLRWMVAETR